MSEYKKQILMASTVAIILALGLGLGIVYLPPHSTTTTPGTVTSISTTTVVTESRTAPALTVVTNSSAVSPDAGLRISVFHPSLLLQGNATKIAYTLASQLNELPITQPNVSQGGPTTYYTFMTANNSKIQVSFSPPPTSVQVDYVPQGSYSVGNATTLNPNFSTTVADNKIHSVLIALGIPVTNVSLYDQIRNLSPNDYVVQQAQSFQNIPLESLGTNPDNTFYYGASGGFYYDYNPANGQLKRLIIVQDYWFDIPSNFPLKVSPATAQTIAENYAIHSLGMSSITSVQVYFAPINNEYLYYAVSVSNDFQGYIIVINPSTGQIGLPSVATEGQVTTSSTITTYSCSVSTITGTASSTTAFSLTTTCQALG